MQPSVQPKTPASDGLVVARKRLSPPRAREKPIDRTRLLRLLDDTPARLVLVRAPAGFGKTTLIQQWFDRLVELGQICTWLTLDDADNDSVGLRAALSAALSLTPLTTAGNTGGLAAFVAQLAEQIEQASQRQVLFIDEINLITNPDAQSLLRLVIGQTGERFVVVASGRSIPMLGQARLKLSGALLEIGEEEMRFLREEAAALVACRVGGKVRQEGVDRLLGYSEGWAAALQLACLSLQNSADPEAFLDAVESFDGDLSQYLQEDVLATQSPAVQEFLLAVSPFREMTGSLCDAVTGGSNGAMLLAELDQAGLFLKRVGIGRDVTWYRFHDLFAAFLRQQLRQRIDAARVAAIHLSGANWYLANELWDEAAEHALLAGDRSVALSVLESVAMSFVARGRLQTVLRWGGHLRSGDEVDYPQLYLAGLWAELFQRNNARAAQRLNEFKRSIPDTQFLTPYLRDSLLSLEVMLATTSEDFEAVRRIGPPALAAISRSDSYEASAISNCLTFAYTTCFELAKARETVELAIRSCNQSDRSLNRVYADSLNGILQWWDLRLADATATLRAGYEQAVAENGSLSHAASLGAVLYAAALYEADRLEDAEELMKGRLASVAEGGFPDFIATASLVAAQIAVARGDLSEAQRVLIEAGITVEQHNMQRVVRVLRWKRALVCQLADDHDECERLSTELLAAEGGESIHEMTFSELMVRDIVAVRLALMRGRIEGVLPRIQAMKRHAEQHGLYLRGLALSLLHAQALATKGRREAAVSEMAQVLKLGLKRGFMRLFIDEGPLAHTLIRAADTLLRDEPKETRTAYQRLLARLDDCTALIRDARTKPLTPMSFVDDESRALLTKRELEIIDIAARGLTNREIADVLSLTERTVKWHLQNAFSKLGVSNRTEAAFLTRATSIR